MYNFICLLANPAEIAIILDQEIWEEEDYEEDPESYLCDCDFCYEERAAARAAERVW